MTVAHQLLTFNISLLPSPTARTSLGTIALLVEDVGTLTQGGGRYQVFRRLEDIIDAGISGANLDACTAAFSQPRKPTLILVDVDAAGAETHLAAYTDFRTMGVKHFALATVSRDATDILALAALVETINFRTGFAAQTSASAVSAWPVAIAAVEGNTHSSVNFCSDDTQYHDIAWLSNRLTFDWDQTAPTMTGEIKGVEGETTLTNANLAAVTGRNINVIAPFGPADAYNYPGVNADGQPFDEVFAVYWFVDRLETLLQDTKLSKDASGQKIPVGPEGQAILKSAIAAQYNIGVQAGHFVDGQLEVEFPSDLTADIAAKQITATASIQTARGANKFTLNLNFSASPLV